MGLAEIRRHGVRIVEISQAGAGIGNTSIQHGLSKRFQFRQILFLEMGAVYPCKLCPFSLLARMKIEGEKETCSEIS